jgi:Tlde1 domain
MWIYEITTGRMYSDKGDLIGVGYSGTSQYKNDPLATHLKDLGPCPVGIYRMQEPVDTKTHGPFVLWLEPASSNEMFGRSSFGIHGDSVVNPGSASEGCIIQSRGVREIMWNSGDHDLKVVVSRAREGAAGEGNLALDS